MKKNGNAERRRSENCAPMGAGSGDRYTPSASPVGERSGKGHSPSADNVFIFYLTMVHVGAFWAFVGIKRVGPKVKTAEKQFCMCQLIIYLTWQTYHP